MGRVRKLFGVLALAGFLTIPCAGWAFPDEPEISREPASSLKAVTAYSEALEDWKTPEEIAAWIGAHFSYDRKRAMELSETQRTLKGQVAIQEPSDFFDRKTGVCLDLARFAVETLRRIDPATQPKYFMIEFEPIEIAGQRFRYHWLASFRRNGKIFLFADSKRPGHIAGPFESLSDFVRDYEVYRARKIVRFQELDSYQKRRQTRSLKRQSQVEILRRIHRATHSAFLSPSQIPKGRIAPKDRPLPNPTAFLKTISEREYSELRTRPWGECSRPPQIVDRGELI